MRVKVKDHISISLILLDREMMELVLSGGTVWTDGKLTESESPGVLAGKGGERERVTQVCRVAS